MSRPAGLMLAVVLVLGTGQAQACRIEGKVWPTAAELAESSARVFVVRIDAVRPIDALQREMTQGQPLARMSLPQSAEGAVLRSLKGQAPGTVQLQGARDFCQGPTFEVGDTFLVFAPSPSVPGGTIVARKGSFPLNDTSYSNTALRQVEARLLQEDRTTP